MIYSILRQHQKLASKRHPMFERNRYAKLITAIAIGIGLVYLILIGLFLPIILHAVRPNGEASRLFNQGMPYLLMLDFYLRFLFQKIPVQEIKPYILLPIPRRQLIHFFMLRSGSGFHNLFWFALLIPFAFSAILTHQGISGVIGFLAGYWVLFLVNNYWYLLCRTLINERLVFIFLPLVFYGTFIAIEILFPGNKLNTLTLNIGEGFISWNPLCWAVPLILLLSLYLTDFYIQRHYAGKELAKSDSTRLRHISEYSFLDRWGETGEYIRLEIRLRIRNKAVRNQFRTGIICMLAFSMLLSFSNIYDTGFMKNFICVYNFAVLGVITLVQIMNVEGNYLDGLISRKESVLSLLKAKYYFNIMLLIIPLVLCIPAIWTGKITVLTAITCLFMTSGPIYALLFQLAVYNHKTFPLDSQITGKNAGGNSFQSLLTSFIFLIPILLNDLFCWIWGEIAGQLILLMLGIILTLTHPWWLQNIYRRFMKRRYVNLDGFRNTR